MAAFPDLPLFSFSVLVDGCHGLDKDGFFSIFPYFLANCLGLCMAGLSLCTGYFFLTENVIPKKHREAGTRKMALPNIFTFILNLIFLI